MESTLAEVLILNRLGNDGFYKMVTGAGGKILEEFEGPRGGGASMSGERTEAAPPKIPRKYSRLLLYVKNKLQVVCLVWLDGGCEGRDWPIERKKPGPHPSVVQPIRMGHSHKFSIVSG